MRHRFPRWGLYQVHAPDPLLFPLQSHRTRGIQLMSDAKLLTVSKYRLLMLRYLQSWIDQLRWQRLKPMEKLARMLLNAWQSYFSSNAGSWLGQDFPVR